MLLTGKHITAQEAYRLGLVNEVVPLSDLMPAAERWAQNTLRRAPLSVCVSKQVSMMTLDWPLEVSMSCSCSELRRMMGSEDRIEGPTAFAEKRAPQWKGR